MEKGHTKKETNSKLTKKNLGSTLCIKKASKYKRRKMMVIERKSEMIQDPYKREKKLNLGQVNLSKLTLAECNFE